MEKIKLILASASPRRHELLNAAGLSHTVKVADVDENSAAPNVDGLPAAVHYALEASKIKGRALADELESSDGVRTFVISADTVVSSDMNEVLGKPHSRDEARAQLGSLSGGTHYVIGGITVTELGGESVSESVVTEVTFEKLSAHEIEAYISTDEPYDKAGGYGIQGIASLFVSGIRGDYANVVGISISTLRRILVENFKVAPELLIS